MTIKKTALQQRRGSVDEFMFRQHLDKVHEWILFTQDHPFYHNRLNSPLSMVSHHLLELEKKVDSIIAKQNQQKTH